MLILTPFSCLLLFWFWTFFYSVSVETKRRVIYFRMVLFDIRSHKKMRTLLLFTLCLCLFFKVNFNITWCMQKLQDDLRMLGMKIKQHEDSIKLLKTQKNKLDDSILDMQGILLLFWMHAWAAWRKLHFAIQESN